MSALRDIALAQPATHTNHLSYRKRRKEIMDSSLDISSVFKRSRAVADNVSCVSVAKDEASTVSSKQNVSSRRGKWNPGRRNFSRKSSAELPPSIVR